MITITLLLLLYFKTCTFRRDHNIIIVPREGNIIIIIIHNGRVVWKEVVEKINKKKKPIDENYAVNVVYPCRLDQTLRTTTVTSIGIRSNLGRARSVFCRFDRVPGPAPPVRSEAAAAPYFTRYVRSVAPQCGQPSSAYHATAAAQRWFLFFFLRSIGRARKHIGSAAPLPS